ncbi:MAG: peptide-methionine (S)-S-oxide reductase MsrA [Halodesulfurarchaeum sp.]
MTEETTTATFAGGCFWCVEAAYKALDGVESATSGYCGGDVPDPSYEEVCTGETGHAEAVQITYDPDVLGYEDLLAVFFTIHDPTTLNRQGPDVGTQYRSAIFTHDQRQAELAEAFIERLEAEGAYDDPIVTEIQPLETFYEAEAYHQDYYEKNPGDGYCSMYAEPKVQKVRREFAEFASG